MIARPQSIIAAPHATGTAAGAAPPAFWSDTDRGARYGNIFPFSFDRAFNRVRRVSTPWEERHAPIAERSPGPYRRPLDLGGRIGRAENLQGDSRRRRRGAADRRRGQGHGDRDLRYRGQV